MRKVSQDWNSGGKIRPTQREPVRAQGRDYQPERINQMHHHQQRGDQSQRPGAAFDPGREQQYKRDGEMQRDQVPFDEAWARLDKTPTGEAFHQWHTSTNARRGNSGNGAAPDGVSR